MFDCIADLRQTPHTERPRRQWCTNELTSCIPQDTINNVEIKQSAEYAKWFRKLKNRQAKASIMARLDACRLAGRPLGDIKPVGGPISEMRFHLGAGYRIYFTMRGDVLMLLLAGGDKGTQQDDIRHAHDILDDYKEQQ